MFTGIIKNTGRITHIKPEQHNIHFTLQSALAKSLSIDQSVAHNGVCLTVVAIQEDTYTVTAIQETLEKTALPEWKIDDEVNLELALELGSKLDGHFVQGHVDTTGVCTMIADKEGSHLITISFPESFGTLIIEKGSICMNGVSLTCFSVTRNTFQVAIIPYTFAHTNLKQLKIGDRVNLEFDILGKYFLRKTMLDAD